VTLALTTALLTFIPILGRFFRDPAALLSVVERSVKVLYVLPLYGAVQFVEIYLATTKLQHETVSLPAATT
jgi:predicted PurR-regulated permease PerM